MDVTDRNKKYLRDSDGNIIAEYIPWCKNVYANNGVSREELETFKHDLEEVGYSVVSIVDCSDSRRKND